MASVEQLGFDAEAICERACLDHDLLNDPTMRVPVDDLNRFWNEAVDVSEEVALGLHVAEHMGGRYNNVLAMVVVVEGTLGQGVQAGLRYQRILADDPFLSLHQEGGDKVLRFGPLEDSIPMSVHQTESMVAASHDLLRRMSRDRFRAKQVRFAHRYRGCFLEYGRIFGTQVVFEQAFNEMVISPAMWSLPHREDPVLRDRLESLAAEMQARVAAPGLLSQANHAVRVLLPARKCDLSAVARQLRLSDRTLQRRLHEEGTSFRQLLDCTRHAIVSEALKSEVSFEEIARRSGFATVRALRRAMARWETE